MVKVCQKQFPKGTWSHQQSDGFYMDGNLKGNIDGLAKAMIRDMQFVGIGFSSTLGVRTGKSTLFQQIGYYYTQQMNELHGLDLKFDLNNIVFKSKTLIERAFELPKYSCIILDEGDDLTTHYMSKTMQELKRFFRKCGQLNIFVLLILPDFFEIPKSFAINRSIFSIDVRFEDNFERGYFKFYSFNKKRDLYNKGKRDANYSVIKPSFWGRFPKPYMVNEAEYRKAKYEDMIDDSRDENEIPKRALEKLHKEIVLKLDLEMKNSGKKRIPGLVFSRALRRPPQTISMWRNSYEE